jgi:tetratricopeptide (TPR) repeat protein
VPVCASCGHETAEDANFCPKCGVPYEPVRRGKILKRGLVILTDHGLGEWIAGQTQLTGYIELLAGDYAAAEREFRFGYDEYERSGETGVRSSTAVLLAEALYEQGRDEEAEHFRHCKQRDCRGRGQSAQVGWRTISARLLARRGELHEAGRIAREAVQLVPAGSEALDAPFAWSSLGEVLAIAGKQAEAKEAFAQSLRLHECKGNIAGAARTRDLSARSGIEMR